MPLAHTGGNYMTDGQGIAISTDLIETENPGLTHSEIEQIANDYLGIHTYHMVPDVNGEYIKHIDCWAKYLAPDVIMIREVPTNHAQYDEIEAAVDYFETQTSCYDTNYEIVRVYTPNNEPYTNSLILNDKVLVPIKGNEWDDEAIEAYENAMPGYEVLGFTGSWQSTDALHCRAKGLPDRYMLYIEHTPLSGFQPSDDGFDIDANIVSYSGEGLIAESTLVFWKVEGDEWNSIQMQHMGDNNYIATIPPQDVGETVYYYIHAEDNSGRTENHPYTGAPDAHSFIVYEESNNPPDKPSTPSGKQFGRTGVQYTYKTDTVDPDDNQVFYMWDWGDGNCSSWLGPFPSGSSAQANHAWSQSGPYQIRVKAKDINELESAYSQPFILNIADGPILEISGIAGGLFTIDMTIRNIGVVDAVGVDWAIDLDGGLCILGQQSSGRITGIAAGDEVTVTSDLIFGFGKTVVNATVTLSDVTMDAKEADAVVVFVFIMM